MSNYFVTGEFPNFFPAPGLRKGRSPRDGYARAWGLEYGGLRDIVLADPAYTAALALAAGRTIQAADCRMNLFLLLKYFLPQLEAHSGPGSIVEFGSYRGGSAIFVAAVCARLNLEARVFGLDTFAGMPPTDKSIDAHFAGNFSDVDLAELRSHVASCGLANRLEFIPGLFQDTAPGVLASARPVLLAHIDCDVFASVAYAWEMVKPCMASGGYVVFDDAHTSGCLGATEAVEELVIRRDGLHCEQIWPHFVFRVWPATALV
jgi:predicted O-methyltransferase YrrM